jgi:hypothetical protein
MQAAARPHGQVKDQKQVGRTQGLLFLGMQNSEEPQHAFVRGLPAQHQGLPMHHQRG